MLILFIKIIFLRYNRLRFYLFLEIVLKMNKMFEELELKFQRIDNGILNKRFFVENLFIKQNELLVEKFNIESLNKKYLDELNNHRQGLLEHIKSCLSSDIDQVNEVKIESIQRAQDSLAKTRSSRNLNFKKSNLSNRVAIRRLINKEYAFTRMFAASQLVKYRFILSIENYIVSFLIIL